MAASMFADGSDPRARTETLVAVIDELMARPSPTLGDLKAQAASLGMAPWGYLPDPDLARMTVLVQTAVDHKQTVSFGGLAHLVGCFAALRAGDVDASRAHIVGLKATGIDSPVYRAATAQNEATLALFEGRLNEVPDMIERVAAAAPGEPMYTAGVAFQRAWLAHLLDRQDEAIERSRAFASVFPYPRMVAATEGLFALAADDLDGARRFLDATWADGLAGLGRDWCWVGTVHTLGELAAALGDRERGAEVEAALLPFSGQFALTCCVYVSGSVDFTLGRLARLRGDETEARRLLEAALALEERSGAVLFAAQTRQDLAE